MCKSKILTCTPDIHANVNLLTHCTVTLRANDEIIFWSSQSARDLEVYFLPLPATSLPPAMHFGIPPKKIMSCCLLINLWDLTIILSPTIEQHARSPPPPRRSLNTNYSLNTRIRTTLSSRRQLLWNSPVVCTFHLPRPPPHGAPVSKESREQSLVPSYHLGASPSDRQVPPR
jgi:hypothetical protein